MAMTGRPQPTIRIAVVSDLHADEPDEEGKVGSLFDVTIPESQMGQHPLAALEHLINAEALTCDLLLCAGDITNRAKPNPLQRAWPWLQRIRDALRAEHLIATVGNHDLDSRHEYNDHDARGMIQETADGLPVLDTLGADRFWARHLCFTTLGQVSVLVLNTCAFHPEQPAERERGRISTYTLEAIRRTLSEARDAGELGALGILLCHHHPTAHPQLASDPDYHPMVRGPELLDLLSTGGFGSWLVVHGHKHVPRLYYAPGPASSPVVFAAGALSARLYDELQGLARNQFYILEIDIGAAGTLGMVGTGLAWDFALGAGWAPAGAGSGLPHRFGFGMRQQAPSLAGKVAALVDGRTLSWDDVCTSIPEVRFLLPADFTALKQTLLDAHELRILDDDGKPVQIGRKT